jgi:hypothetical protein
MIALLAAGHLYVTLGKLLFLVPASEKACGISSLRFGPASGQWDSGASPPKADCEFKQFVQPGALIPVWGETEKKFDELSVTYQVAGQAPDDKPQTVSLKPETLTPLASAKLSATAKKVKSSVRLEVKNTGDAAVLIGDAAAARGKPTDSCVGNGPSIALAPGETLVDQRPGLLSPSMKAWVAVFTSEKACRWTEVGIRH